MVQTTAATAVHQPTSHFLVKLIPSALLCSSVAHDYSWYANMGHFKDGPFGTFKRVARARSLCLALPLSYSRFPLVCPSHLSPCQDSSFIYRKAFIQINTATQRLLCTQTRKHTHTRLGTRILCNSTLPDPGFWSEQNKTRLFWPCSPVCLILVSVFVDCSRSTHFPHFSSTWFLIVLFPFCLPSVVAVRKH